MKWNNRNYRPLTGVRVYPKKENNITDLLKPLGQKENKGNVWIPVLNMPMNVPQPSSQPVNPSPTPTNTLTSTPTPTSTTTNTPTPTQTITPTPTQTITPTPTQTKTPTPTPSSTTPLDPTISFINGYQDGASLTTYNAGTQTTGIGLIVLSVSCSAAGARTSNYLSVGGVNATLIDQQTQERGAGGNIQNALYYIVTTASTNTIITNWSGPADNTNIAWWRIENYNQTTPIYSGKTNTGTSTGLSLTTTSLNNNAVGIATNTVGTDLGITWTNATERYDGLLEPPIRISGADFKTTSVGTRTVSTSHVSTSNGDILIMAVWK